jgi:hypothetical protein
MDQCAEVEAIRWKKASEALRIKRERSAGPRSWRLVEARLLDRDRRKRDRSPGRTAPRAASADSEE